MFGTITIADIGQVIWYFLLVNMSVPIMVVRGEPFFAGMIALYSTTWQGKPSMTQYPPILMEPACVGVEATCSSMIFGLFSAELDIVDCYVIISNSLI